MWEGLAYVQWGMETGDCQYSVMEHDLGTQFPVSWNYMYNPETLGPEAVCGKPGRGRG